VRVTITERHCDVPKKILTRTEDQIGGLAKYEQRATHAEVTYTEEKHSRKVEVVVHVDGGGQVVAHGEDDEFRGALAQAVERARRMLRQQREKRIDHKAPPLSEGAPVE